LILLFFCLGGLLITGQILFYFFQQPSWIGFFILLGNLSLLGGISLFFGYAGQLAIKEAKQTDPGVPLTRANTANLPAPDSLVRASAEPMQEQQAVLLRAATETQERHEEQLVRASAGGTE
jgi:hypothetical protein